MLLCFVHSIQFQKVDFFFFVCTCFSHCNVGQCLLDCLEALSAGAETESKDSSSHSWTKSGAKARGLGAALEAALALLEASRQEHSQRAAVGQTGPVAEEKKKTTSRASPALPARRHLHVLLTGPASLGPGATNPPAQVRTEMGLLAPLLQKRGKRRGEKGGLKLQTDAQREGELEMLQELRSAASEYYQQLAKRASRTTTQVDVLCFGEAGLGSDFASPVLQKLV